jgi:uncharacterized protein (UPF0333 family)
MTATAWAIVILLAVILVLCIIIGIFFIIKRVQDKKIIRLEASIEQYIKQKDAINEDIKNTRKLSYTGIDDLLADINQ